MQPSISSLLCFVVVAVLSAGPAAAASARNAQRHIQALDRIMLALAPESARGAAAIRTAYEDYVELLFLDEYSALEGSLATGGLVTLPDDPLRFNLIPRLEGPHPIGEKDLDNQDTYIAARPFTIGCLLEIASRVRSGPLEITSLVRHGEYQDALRRTNANASTSVPTHTMGLAFDIALLNTPLATVREIRDVLRQMRADGDLLFIGERQQLVFHVVPHPSRLGHFMDVYTAALGAPPAVQAAEVFADAPFAVSTSPPQLAPRVTAEVVAVVPADAALNDEWWGRTATLDAHFMSLRSHERREEIRAQTLLAGGLIARGCLAVLAALLTVCGISVRRKRA